MGSVRPILEDWLDREGVKWEYVESVSLSDIRLDDETKINIRATVEVDQERVCTYAIGLENGDKFPPYVIGKSVEAPASSKFDLIDGIHRMVAMTELTKIKNFHCYLVRYREPSVLDRLRKTANVVTGGLPLREDVRLEHALTFVLRDKYSLTDAARMMNVDYKKLVDRHATDGVLKILVTHKIPVEKRRHVYTKTMLLALRAIKSDQIKAEIADLSFKAGLATGEIMDLIRELKEAKSDQERVMLLERKTEDWSHRIAEGRQGEIRGPMPQMRRFPVYAKKVSDLLEKLDETEIMADQEIRRMRDHARTMIHDLERMVAYFDNALTKRKRARANAEKGATRHGRRPRPTL